MKNHIINIYIGKLFFFFKLNFIKIILINNKALIFDYKKKRKKPIKTKTKAMSNTYYGSSFQRMNCTRLWGGSINTDAVKKDKPFQLYKMVRSNDWNLMGGGGGAGFVAVPAHLDTTRKDVQEKYNIMP